MSDLIHLWTLGLVRNCMQIQRHILYHCQYCIITGTIVVSQPVDSLSSDDTDMQYLKNPKKSTTSALYIRM